jgi:hypothetical protein
MAKASFVIIAGFGLTGSSAARSLLKEFNSIKVYETELRFITDPDGILSLEDSLVNSWSPYRTDKALKRFNALVNKLSNTLSIPYTLLNHTRNINPSFKKVSKRYISRLVSYTYRGTWYGINNPLMAVAEYVNKETKKMILNIYKDIFVSYKKDDFFEITKKYIRELFKNAIYDSNISHIVVDEGFSSLHHSRVMKYFDNCKMIIVHRDPRDNYLNAKNRRRFIPQDVDKFIKWYRFNQEESMKQPSNDNVLRIYFEDLVLNYEYTKKLICDFLSLDINDHVYQKKYFDPSIGEKVVGIWNHSHEKDAIEKISNDLRKYCYNNKMFL